MRAGLDLRLLLPALVAWACAAWAAGQPSPRASVGLAGAGLVLLVSGAQILRRPSRRTPGADGTGGAGRRAGSWSATVALGALAVAAVLACATAARQVERAGPVADLAQQEAVARVRGVVTTQPRALEQGPGGTQRVVLRLRVEHVSARGAVSRSSSPVLVFAGPEWRSVPWRGTVSTTGRLAVLRDDAGSVNTSADVVAVLTAPSDPVLERAPPSLLRGADRVRARLRAAVDPLPRDARALIPALVIGDTSLTPPELSEAMLETGMSHLSAVSGSNVAIVLAAVVLGCRATGVPRRWRSPLAVLALVGFVLLCRPEPSVLRAGVMGLIGLAGLSASRRAATLPALGCAVIVLLCVDPHLARSFGFALSVLATLGLVIFARPWGEAFAARLPARAAVLGHAVAVPLAAQVVCAPVIVLLQGDIAVVAVLANLLAAPVVAMTTVAGVAAALGAWVWVPLGTGLAALGALPAWWIGAVARACAALPWGHVEWADGAVGAWTLAVLTGLLLLTGPWLSAQLRARRAVSAVLACAIAATLAPVPGASRWPPPPGWTLVACDVGQGDAFVLPTSSPETAVVVDVGPPESGIVSCLRDLGVSRVSALVLSHYHQDHVGALGEVLAAVEVDAAFVTPVQDPVAEAAQALQALEQAQVPTRVAVSGTRMSWPGGAAEVVWPPSGRGVAGESAANNASLVLDVTSGPTRVLFTGDIEAEASRRVRRLVAGRRFDVLKVAHHGSADQDAPLVRGVGAGLALIGVGADNSFGHPTTATLTLLRGAGMRVRRTDLHGHVAVLASPGGGMSVLHAADR